jgi:alpha-L-fucosidase 2
MRPLLALLAAALLPAAEPALTYEAPARSWERERLPVGNGRLGAMLDGGVAVDRIQFNEESLWTGDANPSGGFDTKGDRPGMFGAYQNFGEVSVELAPAGPVFAKGFLDEPGRPRAATRDADGAPFAQAHDGDPRTKWVVENPTTVVWRVDLPEPAELRAYALTSANDVPSRDPSHWRLEGSMDGRAWTLLDRREGLAPFGQRHQRKLFELPAAVRFRCYRLSFDAVRNRNHFQLAEVELVGIPLRAEAAVPAGYARRLSLSEGIHAVRVPGQSTRETFASKPAEVVVARYVGERPLSGSVRLRDAHGNPTVAEGAELRGAGRFSNGLEFASGVRVLAPRGGRLRAEGAAVAFEACPELVVLIAARTNYRMDAAAGFRGEAPGPRLRADLDRAAAAGFADLRSAHVADHRSLMDRVSVDWGSTDPAAAALPTDARLACVAKGGADPDLEETLFQYGRYLLVGSSRPGDLPANLQGVWNASNEPAWASDYHTNINLQMNYWLALPANLAECNLPLVDWLAAMAPGSRAATRADPRFGGKVRGWTVRTSMNIRGGHGWEWNLPGNAWLVQHAWEHYAFTRDRSFLRDKAYPMLREVSEFWVDHLKALPDGTLVVPMGWSPEHGPREDGVAHDQQLVWDLFQNTIEAGEALGLDPAFREELRARQARLLGPKVGRWGQLMEWAVDRDNPSDNHRHTSHLLAVHPGRQISRERTPGLAAAAAKSLAARGTVGDSRRSWTWPWRCALWARLGEPERCAEMIRGLLTHNTLPNLFANHPPFQLDGNYGITAGICEMLVQSHAGEVALLPALPKAWSEGSAAGLRARGAVTVRRMTWSGGRLTEAELVSEVDQTLPVRVNGELRPVDFRAGRPVTLR